MLKYIWGVSEHRGTPKWMVIYRSIGCIYIYMDVSENGGFSPQIIHGLIGFSMIFTIHFGVPPFKETSIYPLELLYPHAVITGTTSNVFHLRESRKKKPSFVTGAA